NNVLTSRAVVLALNARVLRPGSSSDSDELVHRVIREWHLVEQERHLEIDGRVFAYAAAAKYADELGQFAAQVGGAEDSNLRPYSLLYSFLWPRGVSVR